MPFDTSVLDRALTRRAAKWERERAALLHLLQQLLPEAAERYGLGSAYIFGSIVSPGRFSELSDVDIAVVELPASSFFKVAAFLSNRLGRDVDLIWLDEVHFAATIKRAGLLWTKSG